MQSFFWNVLSNPEIYSRLNSEIEACHMSSQLSKRINYTEATTQLPYFQACLKEAMRISPAVGLNITRMVPEPYAEVDGHVLPGGTRVALNAWVLHRDKACFGEDADFYSPDRWITNRDDEAGKKRIKVMEQNMFQFGGGSHLCIGRHLALLEMNMILPELLRRYRFKLCCPGKPLEHHSSFFVVQKGLIVKVEKSSLIRD